MKPSQIFLIGSLICGVATAQPERRDESFASRLTGSKCEPGDTVRKDISYYLSSLALLHLFLKILLAKFRFFSFLSVDFLLRVC